MVKYINCGPYTQLIFLQFGNKYKVLCHHLQQWAAQLQLLFHVSVLHLCTQTPPHPTTHTHTHTYTQTHSVTRNLHNHTQWSVWLAGRHEVCFAHQAPHALWWYAWKMQSVWQWLHLWLTCAHTHTSFYTHTHTHADITVGGQGSNQGWGARRHLCALICTSPTKTLWHVASWCLLLLSPLWAPLFESPVRNTRMCFKASYRRRLSSAHTGMWTNIAERLVPVSVSFCLQGYCRQPDIFLMVFKQAAHAVLNAF